MVKRVQVRLAAILLAVLAGLTGSAGADAHHISPQTGEIRMQGNLAPTADGPLSVRARVVDATGGGHSVIFTFERPVHIAPANDWLWRATTDDPSITSSSPLASGLLEFPLRGGRARTNRQAPEGVMTLTFNGGAPPAEVKVQLDALISMPRVSSLRATAVPVSHRPSRVVRGTIGVVHGAFTPRVFTARVGQPVTWINHDLVAHTVTSTTGLFNGALPPRNDGPTIQIMPPPGGFSFTFDQPGTYGYTCTRHPSMRGTIRVLPGR